jgi:hypothetical protein
MRRRDDPTLEARGLRDGRLHACVSYEPSPAAHRLRRVEIVVDRRFRGPEDSANGGYACGLIARAFGGPAVVTLRSPPPLEVPLRVADGQVRHGETLVAEVAPAQVELEPLPPPSWETAVAAQVRHLDSPFPDCFVCGYARGDDALHIHPGPIGTGAVAAPWVPRDDTVGEEFVWAALDCPGAYATGVVGRGTVVLGRLAARVERVPSPGERCVVVGWSLGSEGRKHHAGTALYAGSELLGVAQAVWIEPRPAGGTA